MALYRIHSEEGIVIDPLPKNPTDIIPFVEQHEKEIRLLIPGTYVLGPQWAIKHHLTHSISVLSEEKATYRATPRTQRAFQIDLKSKEHVYGARIIRIPNDQPFVIVAGPVKDFGPIGIFDLCFFARLKLPFPADLPNLQV